MALQTVELLDRFHRVLVDEIQSTRPELLDHRFTVAEIYQDLVPYSTHRDKLGVAMNGDYEHLLLMLLAGEGDYLRLESQAALGELRAELRSPNPNTGLYREYAAADVRLNPELLAPSTKPRATLHAVSDEEEEELTRPVPPEVADQFVPVEFLAPKGEGPGVAVEPSPPAESADAPTGSASAIQSPWTDEAAPEEAVSAHDSSGPSTPCRACDSELPNLDDVAFCPFCGEDLRALRCVQCETALEPSWRFCVACGTEVVGG